MQNQNPIQKFSQSSNFFEKPGILSYNLKTFTSSNYSVVQYFFAGTSHTFPTYQCLQKGVLDFFILFGCWVIFKNKKRPGFYTLVFYIFISNSRSKQNLKNPAHPFVDIIK